MNRVVLTLTGPSLAGKSTLEKRLIDQGFAHIISTTTRPPREGEVNGKQYHFVSVEEFKRMRDNDEMVESVEFNGNLYGGSRAEFEKAFALGKPVVIVVEPNGKQQIADYGLAHDWRVITCFISGRQKELLKRFLLRTMMDKPTALDGAVDRLLLMMDQERKWAYCAENRIESYDFLFTAFNAHTEARVMNALIRECREQGADLLRAA